MALAEFELSDRFRVDDGDVAMSGVQAMLRILIDQLRADRRDGLANAAFVSGYRGSPVGGVDALMEQNQSELDANNITFTPGVNEDLAATAVWGSQLARRNWSSKYDGVLGMWYGKAPGLDRSGDAIMHANISGVDPSGGVLMVTGDDPSSKSSTLASGSEFMLQHLATPILYPGTVQEVLDYGRLGLEMSRYAGSWSALKLVTNVADAYTSVKVGPGRVMVSRPEWEFEGKPWAHTQEDLLIGAGSVAMEREQYAGRLPAAEQWIAHNRLNYSTVPTSDATLGIVAAGKTYYDVRAAFDKLGLSDYELQRRGIRIFKPTVIWPLEPTSLGEFAAGLDTIVVIEEKRGFIESQVKGILYGVAKAPQVLGKRTATGDYWFPGHGEMDTDLVVGLLRPFLSDRFGAEALTPAEPKRIAITVVDAAANRTAAFCSGCPHSTSTWVPEGSEAGGGIGCHGMSATVPERNNFGICHMGAEGIQWVGAAPFVSMEHRFQHIGDGTFHHSGSLAVRQAIAAGTNVTYKILYNDAVAMTGGQNIDGQMPVPELSWSMHAEGAAKVMVVTEDVKKYPRGASFAPGVEIWDRSRLDEAQRLLRDIPGCTVLIYDQECAAEKRRKRKRGTLVNPAMRVFINELVCEGCGDCGAKSTCLSVQPTDTEFGRKTQIHQSSCNFDYTCMEGDCPAFVEVIPDPAGAQKAGVLFAPLSADLPEPDRLDEGDIVMVGIGGTGVVTINQMLATATMLDGKEAHGLDQTGLSQKAGSVIAHMKIRHGADASGDQVTKIGGGEADAFLIFDPLTAVTPINIAKASPDRTVAIVSSNQVPTAVMVRDLATSYPEWDALRTAIDGATVAERNVYFDAGALSDALFKTQLPANVMVLGAAYQAGVIPISAASIERAIEINGTAVDMNHQAFRAGRQMVLDPEWVDGLDLVAVDSTPTVSPQVATLMEQVEDPSAELTRLLTIRVPDLIDYQNQGYSRSYVEFVQMVRVAEASVGDDTRLTEAVARYLYKLMAYKDEYEVARLYRSEQFAAAVSEQFGSGAKITYKLHPPAMRRMGRDKKIGLRRTGSAAFAILARLKGVRGKATDVFGRTKHRQLERDLIDEYKSMVRGSLDDLSVDTYDRAVIIAELPDIIRGYESLKETNVAKFRAEAQRLGASSN
ncbi:MAG: indolepyruvate ferredoxin oxidoreductase family protein [Acidimicrobiales bacterium]